MHMHSNAITLATLGIVSLVLFVIVVMKAKRFLSAPSAYDALLNLKNLVFWCLISPLIIQNIIWIAELLGAIDTSQGSMTSYEDQLSYQVIYEMIQLGSLFFTFALLMLWFSLSFVLRRFCERDDSKSVHLQPAERS